MEAFPYSIAFSGQAFMQAIQCVQLSAQAGLPFVNLILLRGQSASHFPQDMHLSFALKAFDLTQRG